MVAWLSSYTLHPCLPRLIINVTTDAELSFNKQQSSEAQYNSERSELFLLQVNQKCSTCRPAPSSSFHVKESAAAITPEEVMRSLETTCSGGLIHIRSSGEGLLQQEGESVCSRSPRNMSERQDWPADVSQQFGDNNRAVWLWGYTGFWHTSMHTSLHWLTLSIENCSLILLDISAVPLSSDVQLGLSCVTEITNPASVCLQPVVYSYAVVDASSTIK